MYELRFEWFTLKLHIGILNATQMDQLVVPLNINFINN